MTKNLILLLITAVFILFGCAQYSEEVNAIASARDYSDDRILTVLPYDAIPAITNPEFVSANEAKLAADSPVIGVISMAKAAPIRSICLTDTKSSMMKSVASRLQQRGDRSVRRLSCIVVNLMEKPTRLAFLANFYVMRC